MAEYPGASSQRDPTPSSGSRNEGVRIYHNLQQGMWQARLREDTAYTDVPSHKR